MSDQTPGLTDQLAASVIVPTYRGAHRISVLLEALSAQDFDGEWEVLVVVDGRLDETPTVLRQWAATLPLRTIVLEENQGVVAALNRGYDDARGHVLIRCDDDLTVQPDFVKRHVSWHQSTERRGVIGLTKNVFPESAYAHAYGRPADQRAREAALRTPADRRFIHWAANNSVTRDSWNDVGGFNPTFRYGQDSELGWRLAANGVCLLIDPALQADHRGPATTAAVRVARAFVSGSSRAAFKEAHPESSEDSAPDGQHSPRSLKSVAWAASVRLVSRGMKNRDAGRRIGQRVDKILPNVPSKLGGWLVAVCVEAAGIAGSRTGDTDLEKFGDQKSLELDAERGPSK